MVKYTVAVALQFSLPFLRAAFWHGWYLDLHDPTFLLRWTQVNWQTKDSQDLWSFNGPKEQTIGTKICDWDLYVAASFGPVLYGNVTMHQDSVVMTKTIQNTTEQPSTIPTHMLTMVTMVTMWQDHVLLCVCIYIIFARHSGIALKNRSYLIKCKST